MPKVSVCIPAYENPEGVAKLLDSVLSQRFADYEIIITDDSQSGAVEEAAKAAAGRLASAGEAARFRYVRNAKRLGAVPNWNAAVSLASGEYVKLMHHDDFFPDENCLGRLAALLDEDPEAAMAFSGTLQVPLKEDGTLGDSREGSGAYCRAAGGEELELIRKDWRNLYCGNVIGSPSAVLVRRSFALKAGIAYDEELTWLVDMDYYMQIMRAGGKFSCTGDPLVAIGMSSSQLTERCIGDAELNFRERTRIFRKFSLAGCRPAEDCFLGQLAYYHISPSRIPDDLGIDNAAGRYRGAVRKEKRAEAGRRLDTAYYLADKVKSRLALPGNILFYAAFAVELALVIADKSDFRFDYMSQVYRITFVLFFLKLLVVPRKAKESVFLFLWLLFGAAVWRITGRNELLRFAVFVGACRGTDIRKTAKFAFFFTLSGSLALAALSITGIYGTAKLEQVFRDVTEVRYCLGHGHPNALHCMAAMLVILGLWLYDRRMNLIHYVLAALLNTGLYILTDSRLGWGAAMLALLISCVMREGSRAREGKLVYFASEALCIAALVFSVEAGVRGMRNPLLAKLDPLMSGRISSLWESSFHDGTLSSWRLFALRDTEVFFDLGFVRLIYWYGIIPAAAVIILLFAVLRAVRRSHDGSSLAMLTSCMAYTAVEAHLVSTFIGRNFVLLLIAAYIPVILGVSAKDGSAAGVRRSGGTSEEAVPHEAGGARV